MELTEKEEALMDQLDEDVGLEVDLKFWGFLFIIIATIIWLIGYINMSDTVYQERTTEVFKPAFYAIVGGTLFFSGVFLMGLNFVMETLYETKNQDKN